LFGRDDATGLELFVRDQRIGSSTDQAKALRVVGVTDDWATGASGNIARTIYVPWAQDYTGEMAVIGTSKDADGATAAALLRQIVHDADPDLATSFAGSASVAANQQSRLYALATAVVSTLAALAVVLAMTGLYGVLTHLVGRRTREIGVRMALGASSRDITTLVLREGLRPVIIGLIVGAGVGALLRLSLQPFFTRATSGFDAVAIVAAALPLLAAAWLACYLPARRASRVAPTDALRHT
jgi:putative ABC transport system permease protein